MNQKPQSCELCKRDDQLTKHHLIPRSRHKNKKIRNNFDRTQVREKVLWLCLACHGSIHAVLTEKELSDIYNSKDRLMRHPDIKKFVRWVRTKQIGKRIKVKKEAKIIDQFTVRAKILLLCV